MKTILAAALISSALIGGAAFAQSPPPASTAAPAATAQPADKMMLKDNWRASKLIGLNVYNEANEKLGDINELLVDKSGKINAVVVGIGGFLGMGEHDIAVSMDKLKFVEEPVKTSSTTTSTTPRETTTGAASTNTASRNTKDWVPDHAVMSGNKEQLKALPQFKYSDYN
ncbi:PRC-barrel domain-containing protein [Bradyrhizobium guangxiense]|uniref:PRC-barrel domain-containing protein n=1 Tax=Bradyrhizobium guangxiense TaxID=1325115 RepID=UPI001008A21B|nr:PRC-barrel domain-containing protein [Bradyrhizobium guangxiense]